MTRVPSQLPPICDVRIAELVLDGFAPSDRHAIATALERELTRLLSEPDTPFGTMTGARAPMAADRLDGGTITLAPGTSPQRIGIEAARAVGRQLGALAAPRSAAPRSATPSGAAASTGGRRS